MARRARVVSLAFVMAVAAALAVVVPRLRLSTEITAFLPESGDGRHARLAALLAQSQTARVMILDLSLPGAATAAGDGLGDVAHDLLRFLRAHPDVATARSALTEEEVRAALDLFTALPPTTFIPTTAYEDGALRERLAALGDELGGPLGVVLRQSAPRDPLGSALAPLSAMAEAGGDALSDVDGILRTADGAHAILFVETRASPFDSEAQRRFAAALATWRERVAPAAQLETAGAAQFAIASEASMKADISRIGTISTLGVIVVFLVLFGSVRLILLGVVPMLVGSSIAVIACYAIWGEVHGITIAFGTSLLGVGLDYVEHYYAHYALAPEVPPAVTMRRVAPSLVLGAATTIIGFVGLAASGLVGLRQMAAFSVIAIVASITATCLIVPAWMPTRYSAPASLHVLGRAVARALGWLGRRRVAAASRVALPLALVLLAVITALASGFSDDVNMLVQKGGAHVTMDRKVRERLGPAASAFAVVTARDDEALLVAVGKACSELERAEALGALASYVPLDRLAPSAAEQRARFAAAKAAAPRVRQAMDEAGLVVEELAPYFRALEEASPALLTLAELRRSALRPLVAAWFPEASPPVALVPLRGAQIERLRALVPSATIVVPSQTVLELFRGVRLRTVIASALGSLVIFLLLALRYRSARKAAVALAPAALACLATVTLLAAADVDLTILHVMALLLVVSLSVDFGIFLVDTTGVLEESSRTMVSILTASTTTVLSFGLLGASESPGLAALGITVTSGVAFSLLFCFVLSAGLVTPGGAASSEERAP